MLLYITVMLKPLLPIVNDLWEHEFNEIEHISTVHFKYGSHHLQKEVADTGADGAQSKCANTLKTEDQVPFHISVNSIKFHFASYKSDIEYLVFTLPNLPFVLISNQGPPPKFS